jgi:SAM-dependent MidA family methyltransferase
MPLVSLPSPDKDAITHSQRLATIIREKIIEQGGTIPFQDYMEMALYYPGYGYYVAGARKIGKEGDFITAPEISSLFSYCLANQCQQVLESVPQGNIMELGAGLGTMAADILSHLEQLECLPERYYILDLSPDLKQRQYQTLQEKVPHLLARVEWLNALPDAFSGVVLGNEVLDAMPVTMFKQEEDCLTETYVGLAEDGGFVLTDQAPSEALVMAVKQLPLAEITLPYQSEINLNIQAWLQSIADMLQKGSLLLIDYGYTRQEYYLPERTNGTLLCHYQHHVHDDPLIYPGLQDITASVDFTAVAESADAAGFEVAGYTSQASFLANTGLETLFVDALNKQPADQYKLAQQVRMLSLPSEMGERFKVMGLNKALNRPLMGFENMDQRFRL